MIKFFQGFVKITAYLIQLIVFRTKVYYKNKSEQSRKIKGSAIIISNHKTVWDFAAMLFLFPLRTLRYIMAEVLFKKQPLGWFLKNMGGIKVDRDAYDFSFLLTAEEILDRGGVVGGFPEGRLPRKDENGLLEFKPSIAYLAIRSGAPIIPVYTNSKYFSWKRARVIIGTRLYAQDYIDDTLSEKENIKRVNDALRGAILELENELNRRTKGEGKAEKAKEKNKAA